MSYYDDAKNVDSYIQMAKGYDGRKVIEKLEEYIKPQATVLEIGMGPGVDLDILVEQGYKVTGSDRSQVFLDLYKQQHPGADLLLMDAMNMNTNYGDRTFDCIYSNKVLHHLARDELQTSLQQTASSPH